MTPPKEAFTRRGILSISLAFSPSIRGFPSSVVNLPSRILPLIPSPPPSPFFPLPFHRLYSFFSFPSRPSHLNDRLCQSKLKPAFVYLIPRYKYRQTGYRWLLGAATTFLRIRARRDGDGESEIRSGARGERTKRERERKRKGTWKRAPFCRSRRGRRRFSPFGKQFSYDEWTEWITRTN